MSTTLPAFLHKCSGALLALSSVLVILSAGPVRGQGGDRTPPTVGTVTVTPAGGACVATAHQLSVTPTDASGIASATITYSAGGAPGVSVPMTDLQGTWRGTIPAQGSEYVLYVVRVVDASPSANAANSALGVYADAPVQLSAGDDQTRIIGQTATLTAATNDPANIKITEFTFNRAFTGTTSPFPSYIPAGEDDFVEITNMNDVPVRMFGYSFEVMSANTAAVRTYNFPLLLTLPAHSAMILHLGPGTNDAANLYYHAGGTNDAIFSGESVGLVLHAPGGAVIDAVATNGYVFASPVPASAWTSTGVTPTAGVAGATLTGADTNSSTNWTIASSGFTQSLGEYNAQLPDPTPPQVTWTGGVLPGPTVGGTITTPPHTANGFYTYTATHTRNGCTVSDQVVVEVFTPAPPQAEFAASANIVSQGQVVTLIDQSTKGPTGWSWSISPNTVTFVNQSTPTSQNPQVTFNAPGCYTITLTASNAGGSDTETKTSYICVTQAYCTSQLQSFQCISVTGAPTYIDAVVIPQTTLNNSGTNCNNGTATAYTQWPPSGNTTATLILGQTYTLQLTSAATGAIVAWIDYDRDGQLEPSEFINVWPGGGPANTPRSLQFTVPTSASSGLTLLRVRNSASQTDALNAGNACTSRFSGETEDYLITLGCPPAPVASANSPVCVGGNLLLSATGVPAGASYAWSGPNNFFSTQPAPLLTGVTAAQAGVYTLTVTVGGCQLSDTARAVVNPTPVAPVAPDVQRCDPGSVTLVVTNPPSGTTYAWYTSPQGRNPIPGQSGPSYTTPSLTQSTIYYVSAINSFGCASARTAVTALILSNPTPSLSVDGSTSFCPGGSTLLVATGVDFGGTYEFFLNGQSLGSPSANSTLTVTQGGQYTVTATQNGCSGTSAPLTITVTPPPAAPGPNSGSRCGPGTVTLTYSQLPTNLTINWYTQPQNGQPVASGASYTTPSLTQTATFYAAAFNTSSGCESSTRTAVVATVTPIPTATISAGNQSTTICQGQSVTLTAGGGGANATYQFTRNGQPISGATNQTYLATQGGRYAVVVTQGTCSDNSQALSITVNPQSVAAFAYGQSSYCLTAQNPTPTITGDPGGSFSATPTGIVLNAQTGQINLGQSATGTYTITYIVGVACPDTATQTITLTAPPTASFSYSATGPICAGATGTLSPTLSQGAQAGTFSAVPTTGLALNPQTGVINLASSTANTYTVTNTIAAANGCATVTSSKNVTIGAPPTATITPQGSTTFCQGGNVTLTASGGTAGFSHQFLLNGQPIPGATSFTYVATVGGSYSVQVTSGFSGCSATSAPVTVTVNPQPTAAFSYSPTTFCASGQDPTPTITGTPGGTFTSSNGLVLNAQTGAIDLDQSTPGQYAVIYSFGNPCPATARQTITITPAPTAGFSYPATGGLRCAGANGTLTPVLASGATAGTFSSTTGLALNAQTGVISLANSTAGTYTVTNSVPAANGCAATSATTSVTISPTPTATISTGNQSTTICQGQSVTLTAGGGGPNATYQFFFGGQPITGATNSTFSATQAGAYAVQVTNGAGCSNLSTAINLTVNPQPTAGFTYRQAAYCTSGPNPTPTITGTQGGTFSATPTGLAINPQTGAINVGQSTPGTYTVTYAFGQPCPASSTRTVTITGAPSAAFSYTTPGPHCPSFAPLTPTLAQGAQAGTFAATPGGLDLDPATGVIDLGNSFPGTYAVTNTIAAAGGCPLTSATDTVTVDDVPIANLFTDGNTTVCAGDSVTLFVGGIEEARTARSGPNGSSNVLPSPLAFGDTYQFFLNGQPIPGATSDSYIATQPGTYTVVVTNLAGCSATSAPVTITITPAASAAFNYTQSTYCATGQNPTPAITGTTGGTFTSAPAGLSLNASTGRILLGQSTPGTYTVTYSVGGTCPASASQTVTITNAPSATFSYQPRTACAGSPATLIVSLAQGAQGGVFTAAPGGLSINPQTGAINVANSAPNTYTITNTVAAANGCAAATATSTVTLTTPPVITLTAGGPTTFCQGDSVVLTPTGNGPNDLIKYERNGVPIGAAQGLPSLTVKAGGSYTTIIATTTGCLITSAPVAVTVNPQPSAAFSYGQSSYCASAQNPTPIITGAQGGTFSSTAGLVLNAQTGQLNLGQSTPGPYTVTYTVGGTCPASASQRITITTAPSAAFSYSLTPAHCAGSAGTLSPTLAQGAQAGSFSSTTGLALNPQTGVISLANSVAGTYSVTNALAAANGCAAATATTTVVIQPTPTASLSAGGQPTTLCQGQSVTLTASGGGPNATHQFFLNGQPITGATSATFTASAAGSYTVQITNAAGCSATSQAVSVTVNPLPSAAFAYGQSSYCRSGQNPTPTITGTQGGTFSATTGLVLNPQTGQINLGQSSPGTYTVTYAFGAPCPASVSHTVTITNAPSAAFSYAITSVPCAGSATTLSVTLGPGASAGTFSAVPGGLSIDPQTGAVDLSLSSADTYLVTNSVAASGGCAATSATVLLDITAPPTAGLTAGTQPTTICQGQSVTLTASGADTDGSYQFLLNGQPIPGATNATYAATQGGAYSVEVINVGGCSATSQTVNVTVNPLQSAAFSYPGTTFCATGPNASATITGTQGGTFSVLPSTGLTLNATTGAINPSTSQPGTYTVTYTTPGPCAASSTRTVTITTAPSAAFSYSLTPAHCAGSVGTLSPTLAQGAQAGSFSSTTGLALNPQTGVISLANSVAGTYSVTNALAAANGCAAATATTTVVIQPTPTASLSAGGQPTTLCQGQSVTLTASGGGPNATHQFFLNGQPIPGATGTSFSASAAGNYTVQITNAAGCSATSQAVSVTVNPLPSAAFAYGQSSYCRSGQNPTPTITGTQGGTFSATTGLVLNPQTGQINLGQSSPGTYTVTYAFGAPCPASASQTVTITNAPSAAFAYNSTGPRCAGAASTLTPTLGQGSIAGTFSSTAGLTIDPQTGIIDLATSTAGTYIVTNSVPAANGCAAATATTTVVIQPTPTASLSAGGQPTTLCQGQSVTLTASGGGPNATHQFFLNGQPISGATSATFSASAAGSYTVQITNAAGCSATSQAVSVTVNPLPSAAFAYGQSSYCRSGQNPTPTITGTQGGAFSATTGLVLNPQTGAINLGQSSPGTYTVTYAFGAPCPASASQTVTITNAPSAAFTYNSVGPRCANTGGTLTPSLAQGASAGTFSASPTGLSINPATGVISLLNSAAGTYTVTNAVPAANGCAAISATTSLTIDALPVAFLTTDDGTTSFCTGDSVLLVVNPSDGFRSGPQVVTGDTYQFFLNGQPISGATTDTYWATLPGNYTVEVTNLAGCSQLSGAVTISVTPTPSAAFAYTTSTFCLNGANPTPTISGTTGGTFSTTTGLTLNPQTGQINLSQSAAGTYLITYSVTSGACPASASQTVTITTAPSAAFTYNGTSPRCAGTAGTLTPTLAQGASAGTFSSTAGLVLNPATGVINLGQSQAGTYLVTNTIAASGSCAASTATASVTLNTTPTAGLTAAGSTTLCAGGSVTLTASGGGTYQFFRNGQPVNGTTASTLVATQAGSYTVLVTVVGGCSATSAAVSVTVNPLQSAAFNYSTSIYCRNGQNPSPTITGTTGGTFSAQPAGLSLNATTGAITLSSSAAGTYTVTYTTPGPCAATATASVTLTTPMSAAFSYPAAQDTVCSNTSTSLLVSLAPGATAGTFSSSSSLLFDAQTGEVFPAGSIEGTYTIYNTIAASGGCPAVVDSATITIEFLGDYLLSAVDQTEVCEGETALLEVLEEDEGGGKRGANPLALSSLFYQFFLNGQPIAGATSSTYAATQSGDYFAVVSTGAGCADTTGVVTITVNPLQSAAFAYSQGTYCLGSGSATPTITGAPDGSFTASTGLTVDSATGEIDLTNASAGTYTVTYTTPGPCPASATANVTLTTAPAAAFSYLNTGSACAGSAGTLTPTLAQGASAGVFSSTAGLVLNPATGVINLGQSQAGTYSVTNTIAASGACAASTATTTVTLTAAPTAGLTAAGSTTLCAGSSVTLTASGGTSYQFFLNGQPIAGTTPSTLDATQAGSYTVLVTGAGGCSATSAAVSVTVNPLQSAAFAYSQGTYCLSGANPTPTVTGTPGGSFSAQPSGLSLNAQNGTISLTNSAAGTYTVTYTTAGPCAASATATLTLTNAPSAAFSYPATAPACAGTAGTLTPTLAQGAASSTFSSSAGLVINPVTGVISLGQSAAGTYTVLNTVAASGACPAGTASTTVTINAAPSAALAASGSLTFCVGGSVVLTASGGTSYQFLLNGQPINGATAASFTATQAGAYSVVVTSAAGCDATSAALTVTVNPLQSAAFAYSQGTYCLGGTGLTTPTVSGTTGGSFADLDGLGVDPTTGAFDLATATAGTYQVVYTTPGPCADADTVTVTLTTAPSAAFSYPATAPACAGSAGTLTPTLAQGASAGVFSSTAGLVLNPATGVINLGQSQAGTYSVTNTIAASGACAASTATTTVTLTAAPTAGLTAAGSTTLCAGSSVTLTASGGTSYQFFLNGQPIAGTTPSTLDATQAGSYTVLVTGAGGCSATSAAVSVTVNPLQSAAFAYSQGTYCLSGANPTPTVTGTPGGSFSASTGLTVDPATGAIDLATATAGTYTVTYTTAGPCATSATATVTLTTAPSAAFSYPATAPACAGTAGTLTPTLGAGAVGGTFSSSAGLTIDPATGVIDLSTSAAGTYTVLNTVAASGACPAVTASASVTINAAPTAALTASGALTFCTGDSVVLTASGGASYQFLLNGQPINGATAASFTATQAGAYSVVVTSAAGCDATSAALTVTVNPLQSAAFAYSQGTYCLGGGASTPTVTGTPGGTFTASTGLIVDPATGAIDLATATAGTYSVTYTTAGPCAASATATVTLTTAPSAAFSYPATAPACAGTAGTLTPTLAQGAVGGTFSSSAGLTIDPATGTIDLSTSAAGTYTVLNTVAAAGVCPAVTASASVTINAAPTAALTASGSLTFCVGDSVVLTASGGTSYQFLLNGQPINGATAASFTATQAGDYSVVVTSAAGCDATSAALTVTITPTQSAAFAYAQATYCLSGTNPTPTVTGAPGGSFTASAGLTVDPATGELDLTSAASGTYTVTYTTPGPCAASATATITLTAAPVAAFSYPATAPACAGTTGTLTPTLGAGAVGGTFSSSAGLTIDPATGAIDLSTSSAGTYTVLNTVAASGACPAVTASASVTINAAPTAALTASGALTFCTGDSVVLTASGGASYQFLLNGQPISGATASSFTATQAGAYSVVVTSAAGCDATSAALTVTINPTQSAAFTYGATAYCLGGANPTPLVTGTSGGTFTASTGLTVDPTTGALDLATATAGTYEVVYTTPGPCADADTVTVMLTAAPVAAFSYPATAPACAGTAGTLTPTLAQGAVGGTFSSSAGLTIDPATGAIDLSTSAAGTYTVRNTVAAAGACPVVTDSASVTINAAPTAALTASGSLTFCVGDSVVLTASGGTSYQFLLNGQPINGATAASLTATQAGDYSVVVTSAAGCDATSAALTVTITPTQSAAFAYAQATYCLSGTNPTPTVTGAPGGTFTASAGLTVDPATGELDLTSAASGTYTVTYTTPGPCPSAATTTLTLTNAPSAAFSYSVTSPACAGTAGFLMPALATGSLGGTFSAGAGLTIDAATGIITVATSAAGTYTVRNTVAASGTCAAALDSTTITINAIPTAALAAAGSLTFCAGDSVVLSAAGGASYQFLLNGQPIGGATDTTFTATQAGDYSVLVTSAAGCQALSAALTVTVNPFQSAAFAYSAPVYCLSGANPTPTVTGTAGGTFTASSGLTVDPATGEVDLTTASAGTYTVTYTTAGPCPAVASASITLQAAPSAGFSYLTGGPGNGFCTGSTGTVQVTMGTGAQAGVFSAGTGLTIDPATGAVSLATSLPGTYTVVNTVAAGGGCPAVTDSSTITIEALPVVTVTAAGPTTFCQGDSVTLTATGGGKYLWSTGDTLASITVSTSGSYSVVVTNAAGCQATSAATVVTATPQASAAFAYASATYCLAGTNPVPTITGTAGGTFSSTTGLVLDSFTGEIILGASSPGTYTVTYNTGTACPASGTTTLTLTAPGVAAFTYALPGGCAGTPGTITPTLAGLAGTFTAIPATGLSLDPVTGAIDLSTSAPGTYFVSNTLAPSGLCSQVVAQDTVTILALPTVAIQNLSATLCQNDPAVPLTGTINGQPLAVMFTVNGTPATSFDPALLGPGTYTVVASGSVGACAGSATATVTVNPAPAQPVVVQSTQTSGVVLLSVPVAAGQTVQWFLNGAPVAGATNDTLAVTTAAQNGSYTAVVTGANGCASLVSAPVTVTITAVPGVLTAALLQLYPNPTTDGQVVVELPALAAAASLTIYDAAGRRVFATTLVGGTTRAALDLHMLPTGVYMVKVGAAVRRLVRE